MKTTHETRRASVIALSTSLAGFHSTRPTRAGVHQPPSGTLARFSCGVV
jgi:hypothetical protein